MRAALLFFLCTAGACTGVVEMKVPPIEPKAPVKVEGALSAGAMPQRSELGMSESGQQLGLIGGALAAAGLETLYLFDRETRSFAPVPVGDVGESMALGPVRHLARRGAGLFLVAEGGIFHDAAGRLLRSPLSGSVAAVDIRALDDLGEGEGEELWLTTAGGVERIRAGVMTHVAVSLETPLTLDLAVGVEKDRGLLLSGTNIFSVDLQAGTAKWEAKDLPPVSAVARTDDGTVLFATAHGLYARPKTGDVKLYTFAAEGAEAKAVADVYSAFGESLVAVDGQVAQLSTAGGAAFGALAAPRARGLVRDSNGDTFALDGSSLVKLATGRVVSFEADVKPFFVAHCMGCHTTGANYSPVFDLTQYAVVAQPAFRAKVIQRLTANGRPPMPPSEVEVLTSSDYAVVLRWVAGGTQP